MKRLLIVVCLVVFGLTVASAQWVETRRAFKGTKLERTISVPYYYPYVAEPDYSWGFFYDYGRLPAEYRTPAYQRLCFRQMASIGLNTFTAYGWLGNENLDDLNMQLQTAQEEGLIKRPVPLLPCGDPRVFKSRLKIPAGVEAVGYGPDEPGATEEAKKNVVDSCQQWHEAGFRVVSAISADSAKVVGGPLDIWMVHVPKLGEVKPDGKHELWAYDCELRGTNAPLHRYQAGLYSYAAHRRLGVNGMFLWAYVNDKNSGAFLKDGVMNWNALRVCEHTLPGPDGPLMTVGMEGMRDGIVDFKLLHEVERRGGNEKWLDKVTKVPLNFWEGTDMPWGPNDQKKNPYWWDTADLAKPLVDMDKIRMEACKLLHLPSPD